MGTTAQDVEKSIEVAILDPTHSNEAIALEKLQAFVSKKPDEVPGLEARLQALYHGKVAPLSTFIEFLFVIRQHLSPETVNKVWWELVLKPALKREPLTTSTTRHAIEIALIGLQTTANSHAFRLRLLSLYIHGVPNPASTEEALDTAAMNKVERSQLVRWKAALIDILLSDCVSHPTVCLALSSYEPVTLKSNRNFLKKWLANSILVIIDSPSQYSSVNVPHKRSFQ